MLLKDFNGKPLNGPNDVWIRPESADPEYAKGAGGMYLTDSYYLRAWWKGRPGGNGMQQPGRYVYYFSPDHKTLTPVVTNMRNPNGIIGTPDSKTLYVSDIEHNLTYVYKIAADGTLSDEKLFCRTGSDGMTIDDEGNVYTTHASNGLYIWDKNGKRLVSIPLSTGNVCFNGGKGRDILFICAVHEIYALRMRTHGVGPARKGCLTSPRRKARRNRPEIESPHLWENPMMSARVQIYVLFFDRGGFSGQRGCSRFDQRS